MQAKGRIGIALSLGFCVLGCKRLWQIPGTMPTSFQTRLQMLRRTQHMLAGAAVFAALYTFYLAHQNNATERYLEGLRASDPVRYLDDIRRTEGFDSYVEKYRLLEGYVGRKDAAPGFLIGRWTLVDQLQRVPTGTLFPECRRPITFEHGLLGVGEGPGEVKYPISYRISGSAVYLSGPDISPIRVVIAAYGSAIDHLQLTLPDASGPTYAYPCGG